MSQEKLNFLDQSPAQEKTETPRGTEANDSESKLTFEK
jgi:hypothetical protein